MMLKRISGLVLAYLKVGGQREAIPYLDKAIKGNVPGSLYLAAANNYIAMEQRKMRFRL